MTASFCHRAAKGTSYVVIASAVVLMMQAWDFMKAVHTARVAAVEGWAHGSPDRLAKVEAFIACADGRDGSMMVFVADCAMKAGGEAMHAIVAVAEDRADMAMSFPLTLLAR